MQKRRAKRDAFGGSVRRNRVVYFTRSSSGRIRRQPARASGGSACRSPCIRSTRTPPTRAVENRLATAPPPARMTRPFGAHCASTAGSRRQHRKRSLNDPPRQPLKN
ncbi:hypothetical protein OH687_25565 [Burkholderia anthina]|nr:hypothetical protein OH687_25565 [Burkholderia anthina]